MNVKEIRELEKEVVEVSVEDGGDVEEETSEDEDKQEEFSIGDIMLARADSVEGWGAKNLEDTISDEDLDEDSVSGDFEEEEEEDDLSYGSSGEGDVGGLYGETTSSGEMYGGMDASVKDLYGTTNRDDSVSMYNTSGGSASEGSLYSVAPSKKRDGMVVEYKVEGPRKKKSSVRRRPKSDLEVGVKSKRRNKGVSLY